ncbi:DUF7344 domain-containing protein [Natronoarchaeum rubrum]|uniref:DUF7344 domain-containing protein n=1 Tax=Natronoarchaeum rubrum TaxID=755311 RepID=UPI00211283D2|nr:hypothetical protein [Natronoarchaeum rubrum]HMB49522.1 hypothetical protein [Natronoarchaeum rubrum]
MNDDRSGREAEETTDESRSTVSKSRAFELLSNHRRRHALWLVYRHDRVSLPDIAEEVTVAQSDADITEIDPERVRDTYMMLYHSDVPKLAEADVVAYDQELDMVAAGENFQLVADILTQHFAEP